MVLLYNLPASPDNSPETVNSEIFRCSETVGRHVSIVFRSARLDGYAEYLAIVGIDGADFYAFVKQGEKRPKVRLSQTEEFVASAEGEWISIRSLPSEHQKTWPGIENLFTQEEKMALWQCFREARGYKFT